ncbi:DUF4345 family protein [Rhodococcus sp. NPDC058521]|uniref:DUF4345 family protein n=1 Tax=Rhodococcus sp. NPDC058521 TaxID=3346536 RepID=UPI0036650A83
MTAVLILLVALFFLCMGLYGLTMPDRLTAPFSIAADSATSRTEVRAVYGGFGVAVAVALVLAAFDVGDIGTGVCIAVAAALAGMAFGRIVSALVGDRTGFYPVWFYFVVELVLAGMLVVAVAVG